MVQPINEDSSMTDSDHQSWISAILHDDHILINSILNNRNIDKNRQLNETLKSSHNCKSTVHADVHAFTVYNPLSLAVAHGSTKVVQVFLSHGIDVLQVDQDGNNIIHKLIEFTFMDSETEDISRNTYHYLEQLLELDKMKNLLMTENNDSLRPLELAAHLGVFPLFEAILETDNVYMTKEEIYGINKLQYFDVTEYEAFIPNTRRQLSPVALLKYLDKSKISEQNRARTKEAFHKQPLCSWLDANFASNRFYILIWASIRILFVTLFYFVDFQVISITYSNSLEIFMLKYSINITDMKVVSCSGGIFTAQTHLCMMFLIILFSFLMIMFDFIDIFRYIRKSTFIKCLQKNPRGKKEMILHITFYRICHFVSCIGMFTMISMFGSILLALTVAHQIIEKILFFLVVIGCVTTVWSILYFIQLIPILGCCVISIQRMLSDLAHFIAIFVCFQISFNYAFLKILDNSKYTSTCPEYFSSIYETMYSTFMVMLNMINLTQYEAASNLALRILHIFYIFMSAILLINFLIAIFSSSYIEVRENRHVISRIQSLSVSVVLANRIPQFMYPLSRWLQKEHYVVEGDRIYITRLVPIQNK